LNAPIANAAAKYITQDKNNAFCHVHLVQSQAYEKQNDDRAATPATAAPAAPVAKVKPFSRYMKNTMGPAITGKPESIPATPAPHTLPQIAMTAIKAGTRNSFTKSTVIYHQNLTCRTLFSMHIQPRFGVLKQTHRPDSEFLYRTRAMWT
jgi:hypothetical protein